MSTQPKTRKKRPIRLIILGALVVTAGLLLWLGNSAQPAADSTKPGTGTAGSMTPAPSQPKPSERSVREIAYERDTQTLRELTQNQQVSEQTREDAAQRLQTMVESHQTELAIEEALTEAGFSPCLVLLQNGAMTVMVEGVEMDAAQSASILTLCAAHTQIGVENIRIMAGP